MTSAVPAVGSSAAPPGQGVALENTKADATTAAIPTSASARTVPRPSRVNDGASTAVTAPSASSHTRVVVKKYAGPGFEEVKVME